MIKRRSLPILLAALFLLSAGCDSPSGAPAAQTPGTETDPAAEKKAQEAQAADGENTAQEQDMQAQVGESD